MKKIKVGGWLHGQLNNIFRFYTLSQSGGCFAGKLIVDIWFLTSLSQWKSEWSESEIYQKIFHNLWFTKSS